MEGVERTAFQIKSMEDAEVRCGDELGMEELSEGAGVAEVGECGGGSISRTE